MKFSFPIFKDSSPFFLVVKGRKRCPAGSRHILSAAECVTACADLDIPTSDDGILMDGKKCYKGGNENVCNQNATAGKNALMICKNRRNQY